MNNDRDYILDGYVLPDVWRFGVTIDQICSNVASATSHNDPSNSSQRSPTSLSTFATTAKTDPLEGTSSYEALNLSITNRSPQSSSTSSVDLETSTTTTSTQRKHSWPIDHPSTASPASPARPKSVTQDLMPRTESKSALSNEESGKERRRRQKLANKDNLFCQVCGDKANGYNFGAITCESCKAFFRRNALKNKDLRCNFDNSCKIDHFTRKFCTACRLNKCFAVNMKKEWILDEDALKKRKKLTRRSSTREEGSSDYEPLSFPPLSTSQMFGASNMSVIHPPTSLYMYMDPMANMSSEHTSSEDKDYPPLALNEDDLAEVSRIMSNHALIDTGSDNSPPSTTHGEDNQSMELDSPDSERNSNQTSQVLNIADGFIRKLIQFVKTLPEYRELHQGDQIALLKGGVMETLVIRSAILYEPGGDPYRQQSIRQSFIRHGLGEQLYSEHMKIISSLNEIAKWEKAILVLIMIINLFNPERAGVLHKEQVRQAEERYSILLQAFLRSKYTFYEARQVYPLLFIKINAVRQYSELCAQHIARVNPEQLEPLMKEVFNMR